MKPTALCAAGIAAATIVAACGDDTEPLMKEEFIEQADAICAETNERVAPIFEAVWADIDDAEETSGASGPLVFVRFDRAVDEAMPHFAQQLSELRGLEPPAEDEELVTGLLDDHESALARGAELAEAAAGGDEAAIATLDNDDPIDEVERRVRAYGMRVCGGDG